MTSTEYATKLFGQLDTLEHRYRNFMRGALLALAILFASNIWLAVNARSQTAAIQQSRYDVCIEQNDRHDRTLRALDSEIAKLPSRVRARAESRRPGTVALIDALAPRRDCKRFAPL